MADIIIPDDCGLVTSSWSLSGKSNPITSTLGVRDISSGDPEAILSEVYNGWVTTEGFCDAGNMAVGWTFQGVSMIWNAGGGVFEGYAYGDSVAGTMSSSPIAIVNSSLLLQKRTNRIGRHFRGRMYLPMLGTSEAAVDPMGNIETVSYGIQRDWLKATTDFWDDSDTWEAVLLHSDTVVTPGYNKITAWNLATKVATQRRRLRS